MPCQWGTSTQLALNDLIQPGRRWQREHCCTFTDIRVRGAVMDPSAGITLSDAGGFYCHLEMVQLLGEVEIMGVKYERVLCFFSLVSLNALSLSC